MRAVRFDSWPGNCWRCTVSDWSDVAWYVLMVFVGVVCAAIGRLGDE